MFDAHCHLDLPAFDANRGEVIRRAREAGVEGFVVAGVGPDGWAAQRELARREARVYITLGVHPWTAAATDDETLELALQALDDALGEPGDVAPVGLGELGLDRGRRIDPESLPRQERAFRAQLAMARDRDLPAVLHLVRCHGAALAILQRDGLPSAGGMVHGFSGSAEMARSYAALGLHVSFSTAIARPQSRKLRAACRVVPADLLLVETDSPDQAPSPSGQGQNEPANLGQAIAAIALARGEDPAAIASKTADNARRLFRL